MNQWTKYGYKRFGQALEHSLIVEAILGRPLTENECVHHYDGDGSNNNFTNLRVMTKSRHRKLHANRENSPNVMDRVLVTCPLCKQPRLLLVRDVERKQFTGVCRRCCGKTMIKQNTRSK